MSSNRYFTLGSEPDKEETSNTESIEERVESYANSEDLERLFIENRPTVSKKALWVEILENIGSSLSVCLMSFPVVLALTLSIDDRLPKNEELKLSAGVMTLFLGFIGGFFLTGGNCIFKSFTGTLHL